MPSTARLVSLYNNALHLQRAVAYAMSPLRARARIYPTSEDTIWCSLFFGNQLIYSYLISVRVTYVYSLSLLLIFSQVRWFKVALQLTLYYTDWFYISAPPLVMCSTCTWSDLPIQGSIHLLRCGTYNYTSDLPWTWISDQIILPIITNSQFSKTFTFFRQFFGPKRYLLTPMW